MKLIKQSGKSWLAVGEDGIERILAERILSADVWFSDLDGTDAKPPARMMTMRAIGTSHLSTAYITWHLKSAFRWMRGDRFKAKVEAWKSYNRIFLGSIKAMDEVKEFFSTERAAKSLYPHVEEFYSLLRAEKYYVTRNIGAVASAYRKMLGFRGFFAEVKDKGKTVEGFILSREPLSYGCSGDSEDDLRMADVLRFYERKGRIRHSVSVFCGKKPSGCVTGFDAYTSRDRGCLVDFLKDGIELKRGS